MFLARVLIVLTAVFAAGAATAQVAQVRPQDRAQGESACGRDASRVCKKVINDGDTAVLNCLKENRARLRPVCLKQLQEHGQL
jgi:hypothetical protein